MRKFISRFSGKSEIQNKVFRFNISGAYVLHNLIQNKPLHEQVYIQRIFSILCCQCFMSFFTNKHHSSD